MGVASAAVCFGFHLIKPDFPWNSEDCDGDYEYWWALECGFEHIPMNLRGENWYKSYSIFKKAHPPVPFEPIMSGLIEDNSWVLAVPGSETIVHHDDLPWKIDLDRAILVPEWRDYKKFVRKYFEDLKWNSIKWYLISSYHE